MMTYWEISQKKPFPIRNPIKKNKTSLYYQPLRNQIRFHLSAGFPFPRAI
ncbi:GSCOCG00005708001-RA-CDS [Cotesia congregata]|nr:GSCOCG00005708001-RA-CDS [Cotesia congregata]